VVERAVWRTGSRDTRKTRARGTSHSRRPEKVPTVPGGNRGLISVGHNRSPLANKANVVQLRSAPILTRRGLADRYKISVRTVDRWVAGRLIPATRVGRCLRFDVARCDAALRRFTIDEVTKQ
jgi:hypothetical protein